MTETHRQAMLTTRCAYCGAQPEAACRDKDSGRPIVRLHALRMATYLSKENR